MSRYECIAVCHTNRQLRQRIMLKRIMLVLSAIAGTLLVGGIL